jgi:hypothetical protein
MERMAGGQNTWAKWKDALQGLPPNELPAYLRDVEGYTPEQVREFLKNGLTTRPEDWHVTPESEAAVARHDAWMERTANDGEDSSQVQRLEARGAAVPPGDEKGT